MKSAEVFDISVMLGEASVEYPGDDPFSIRTVASLAHGDVCDLSRLAMSAHAGTHLDSPAHFIPGGKTLDRYPPERFILMARVIAVDDPVCVKPIHFHRMAIASGEAVLFKTRNSVRGLVRSGVFTKDYIHLTPEAADLLVERKAGLVGIDYLSVDRYGDTAFPVHHALLKHDIPILEGIDLKAVPPGRYRLFCPPLKMKGAEASPVRAVLMTQ